MIIFSASKPLAFTQTSTFFRHYLSATALDPSHSLLHLLQLSIDRQSLHLTQQSHAQIHHLGLDQHSIILTKLISAYALCRRPFESRLVFDSIQVKNVYLWNTLINGYAKNHLYKESFHLFNEMCRGGASGDEFTLSTLSKVSGEVRDLLTGKSIHGKCIKMGFILSDPIVANTIMSLYCKCDRFVDARNLFNEMPQRSVSSWNVMIAAHVTVDGFHEDLTEFVESMQMDGLNPDAFTVSSLLPLCGGKLDYGRELHSYVVKNGLELGLNSDVHLGCCLIDMYSKNKRVEVGRRVFDQLKSKNVFAWTAMISGYVLNGDSHEGIFLFRVMQGSGGIEPNQVSLVSVLPACSLLAGVMGGKQIHGFAIRKELNHEVSLANALIDMYAKCGCLKSARLVFEYDCICKDAVSWSSMISGYGLHGQGQEAIVLYDKMLQLGIKPDLITIVAVLSACSRSKLVKEGLDIYSTVVNSYGIKPTSEICACMVDMLGRAGQLDKAVDFIKTMPVEPGPSVWGALVGGSALHGNNMMRDLVYKFLIEVEPANPSNYVSLSNLYASSRRWDAVAEVRTRMKERGLRKSPGCSWISINSETHSFYVADKEHPRTDMIYEMMDDLILAMKGGNSPDFEILT